MSIELISQKELNTENKYFCDLIHCLIEPKNGKLWLQQVSNLLQQYIKAKYLFLHSYVDNIVVFSSSGVAFNNIVDDESLKSKITIPLSVEGRLEIVWDCSENKDLDTYADVLKLIAKSLENRAVLISQKLSQNRMDSLLRIKNILNADIDFKSILYQITKELGNALSVSRSQIKIFSQSNASMFDSNMTLEVINDNVLESISVIPQYEYDWISTLKSSLSLNDNGVMNLSNIDKIPVNEISKGIEGLLSVKSFLGVPIFYKSKPLGVLCFHQCNYVRVWKESEIQYLNEVAFILGLVLSNQLKVFDDYEFDAFNLVLDSDQFLRELNHCQVESQVKNNPFSLILVDIDGLKDINLKMGFVAGNLVLDQTARYLRRLHSGSNKIARYNNDEFVIILNNADGNVARIEAEKVKDNLSNISVLGVGPVDYSFSFVTYPIHADTITELLTLLEQSMILSKSRGKLQVSSYDELKGQSSKLLEKIVSIAIPEIISKKISLKTGPDIIENIQESLARQSSSYNADILDSVQSLVLALDAKDSYTEGHSKRVSEYAYLLAKSLGLDLQELEWIRLAAMMHDIGKIGIPESILCKPAKLTKEEFEVMKKHPVIGARILKPIKPLEKVSNLVLYHHEYWDGSGYPNGLSKTEVPLGARIVSIVDAYQAMTSNRPYRSSLSQSEAIKRLKEGREKQWDPELIDLFLDVVS